MLCYGVWCKRKAWTDCNIGWYMVEKFWPKFETFYYKLSRNIFKIKKCFNYKKNPYTVEHGKSEHG